MDIRRRELARAVVNMSVWCVVWSVFWYLHTRAIWSVLPGMIQGILMGAFMAAWGRNQFRRAFVAGGRPASDDERTAALAALRSGQLPSEPRKRDVALAFARNQLGRRTNPWRVAVVAGLSTLMSVFLAIVYNPWCWLLAGFFLAFPAALIVALRRRRRRARTLLMTLPAGNAA
ncbi:hypothetical protein [Dactylosporangium darangshiense]|uniref:Integral membrane protein n=1 Tax=Dactylosporangium darangshiense TaxID=579108 RepID=A0ABP8DST6_9ACTN